MRLLLHSQISQSSVKIYYSLQTNLDGHGIGTKILPKLRISASKKQALLAWKKKLTQSSETKPIKVVNNHCLELYIERVTKDLRQNNGNTRSKLPDNLPVEARKALDEMQKWKDIIIRPADKGSRYFFLDRDDYINRVKEHLYDKDTLEIVDKEEAELKTKTAINNWLKKYRNEPGLTPKLSSWIVPDDTCKPGNNYVNPKAHKPEKNYPGRMISTLDVLQQSRTCQH